MIPEFLSPLANHLWQSTLFAGVTALLALVLRKNRARVRYWIWMVASVKFLIPFSLLVSIGELWEWQTASAIDEWQFVSIIQGVGQPFGSFSAASIPASAPPPAMAPASGAWRIPALLFSVWLCGCAVVSFFWLREWGRLRAALKRGSPLQLDIPIKAMSCRGSVEPGVVGIFRPVLLLPEGIADRLTPAQFQAMLVHELCHVRRRDNLGAAIHMVVEVVFWFHPLVWWIESQLLVERERACDEEVLRVIGEPQVYAECILNVCRFYRESPFCASGVSGVTGSNLKKRIEEIMRNRATLKLSLGRILLLAAAATTALAGPVAIGIVNVSVDRVQAPSIQSEPAQTAPPPQSTSTVQEVAQPPEPLTPSEVPIPSELVPPSVDDPATVAPSPQELPSPPPAQEAFESVLVTPSPAPPPGGRGRGGARGPAPGGAGQRGGAPGAEPCGGGIARVGADSLVVNNISVYTLISWAYGKGDCSYVAALDLVSGGPAWIRAGRFDIEAVLPEGTPAYTAQQLQGGQAPKLQAMLRALLADRFKLVLHPEMKETPAYELTLGQTPPKLTAWQEGDSVAASLTMRIDQNRQIYLELRGAKMVMPSLAGLLALVTRRPVLDRTGIEGEFNLVVEYDNNGTTRPPLAGALEAQLGLKLAPVQTIVEVLVIDEAENPAGSTGPTAFLR